MDGNRHYILVDEEGRIVDGWSDGPHPERETGGAVCLTEDGGYQFRLSPGGEENPPLKTIDGVPLYRWDGSRVVERTPEEIEADRGALPLPGPTAEEQMRADIDYLAALGGVVL